MDWLVYAIVYLFVSVIRRLPIVVCFAIGQGVGCLLWLFLPPYRRLAAENMRRALDPNLTTRDIQRLVFKHFVTLGANLLSSIRIANASEKEIRAHVELENEEPYFAAIRKGRGVVMAISHIGNWELFAQIRFYIHPTRGGTVFQAIRNKYINAMLTRDRERQGVLTFERHKGFNGAMALLREGGVLGVLVDQHAGDSGLWTPFFGRLASTSPLAATLAARTNAEVVPMAVFTCGFAQWRVAVSPAISYHSDNIEKLTVDINRALETQITRSPADWFWVHNRWKTPDPDFLLQHVKRGIYLPDDIKLQSGSDQTSPDSPSNLPPPSVSTKASDDRSAIRPPYSLKPFRILIRSSNWLGDGVMSVPAVRAIKNGRPDAHVTILCQEKLADFWRAIPEIDEVITLNPKMPPWQVAAKIRHRFDVAILFPNSLRSALEVWLARIPRRVGFAGHRRRYLLNQIIPEPKGSKAKKKGGCIAKGKAAQNEGKALSKPAASQLSLPPSHDSLRYLWMARKMGADITAPPTILRDELPRGLVIGVCPGAEYGPAKRWPIAKFRTVMDRISSQYDCHWKVLGVAKDTPLAQELLNGFTGNATDLSGKTSLKQLIEELKSLQLLLTNDTGTMHLAALFGVPTVAIFGSTDPTLTGPLGTNHHIIRHPVECSPCFLRECPIDFRCMEGISTEEVTDAITQILSASTSSLVSSTTT